MNNKELFYTYKVPERNISPGEIAERKIIAYQFNQRRKAKKAEKGLFKYFNLFNRSK